MNVVTTIIKSRHSVRNFKPDPVNDLVIKDALECAARAPTAKNLQPWLFGVIRNKDMLCKVAQATDNGKFIAGAPVCFAVFGEKNEKYYLEDCCAATENLILALHGIWHQLLLGGRGKETVRRNDPVTPRCPGKLYAGISGCSRLPI